MARQKCSLKSRDERESDSSLATSDASVIEFINDVKGREISIWSKKDLILNRSREEAKEVLQQKT